MLFEREAIETTEGKNNPLIIGKDVVVVQSLEIGPGRFVLVSKGGKKIEIPRGRVIEKMAKGKPIKVLQEIIKEGEVFKKGMTFAGSTKVIDWEHDSECDFCIGNLLGCKGICDDAFIV